LGAKSRFQFFASGKELMQMPFIRSQQSWWPLAAWGLVLLPFILPILFVMLLIGSLIVPIFLVAYIVGWTVMSPLLPQSRRIWNHEIGLDSSVDAECPTCRTQLALGPVVEQVHVDPGTKSKFVMPAQNATCPQCGLTFRRCGLGKIWS